MRKTLRFAVIVCALLGRAAADEPARPDDTPPDAARLEVAVGARVTREVGVATGLRCDDLAIARVELRTATPESNVFEVTGVAPGTTRCRVGTVPNRPTYLFEIHVVPALRRR